MARKNWFRNTIRHNYKITTPKQFQVRICYPKLKLILRNTTIKIETKKQSSKAQTENMTHLNKRNPDTIKTKQPDF